jgi:hypothetical protein
MTIETQKVIEGKEKGSNVEVLVRFMRHGERDKAGKLLDLGRDITRQQATNDAQNMGGNFDAIKAIGSDAGPKGPTNMERALETAHIYAQEIAGDDAFKTRVNSVLSYETLKNPVPYNHVEIYNANLPANFESLRGDEYVQAAKRAQSAVINHLLSLNTPEAKVFIDEVAGAFALVIEHYIEVAKRINSESKVLIPAGTHGGLMELLLKEALVRVDGEGNKIVGFKNIDEIGGEFNPSESYDVDIRTDEKGDILPLKVYFTSQSRPKGDMFLDLYKLHALSEYYRSIHKDEIR